MFGMGFTEILLIAIVAVIALGPDKLPTAMVQIAKVINKFKNGIADAKSTLDSELNISEMKSEANKFKAQLEDTKSSLMADTKIDLGLNDIMRDDIKEEIKSTNETSQSTQKVSFKKTKKNDETLAESNSDKLKVKFDDKKEDNV